MHVAVIKSNYTPYGGSEKYTTRLINAFLDRGADVDVLTTVKGRWTGLDGRVHVQSLFQFRYNNLLRLLSFNSSVRRHLEHHRYDIIFGMDRTDFQTHLRAGGGCHAAWLDRRCAESSAVRCLSFRINPFHRASVAIERRAFLSPELKRIFCNSDMVRMEIAEYYPAAHEKTVVVHNGVEWEEFEEAFKEGLESRTRVRQGLGLDPERFYYLFVGSGYERKGLKKAIAALGCLPIHVDLLVVGKDRNVRAYKRYAASLGLHERVHFFGPKRDVVPFLQAADAFVLPTLYDPFSNASLEALAMGLFTVTSRANGCAEVIREGAGAVIENLRDIDSVAEAMNAALSDRLGRKEIRESVRHLDFGRQLGRIVDICLSDARQQA